MRISVDEPRKSRTSPTPRKLRTQRPGSGRLAFWLVIPAITVLAVIIGYPLVQAIIRSFFGDSIGGSPAFVGFENYASALWGMKSAEFWDATGTTYALAAVTVVLETLIGLGMALVMNRAFRGRGIMRAAVLIPWAIPTAVTAVLWKWSFDPAGIINAVTGSQIVWTGAEWSSRFAIVVADTWKTSPFIALLILAGLQIIPGEVYEAAKIDGAGALQRFRLITLPLVNPALLVAILFRVLDALRMYDLPQILTHGANGTTTLSILVVQATLSELKPGYGGALSTLTFVLIFITAFFFVRVLGANAVDAAEK